jgi:hypothetical protein
MNDDTLKHTNTCEHKFTKLFYNKSKQVLKHYFHFIAVDIVASIGQYDHDKTGPRMPQALRHSP